MCKCLWVGNRRVHFLGVMRRRCAGGAVVGAVNARYVMTYDTCEIITHSFFTLAMSGCFTLNRMGVYWDW